MAQDESKRLAERLKEASKLLGTIGVTPYEGVNANVKKAFIAVNQALFNLGEEDREK